MLRAIRTFALLALAALSFASPTSAQNVGKTMDGIGLIDYSHRAGVKVGLSVEYRVTGHSSKGHSEDYRMVVGMAGEERFWGDDGFWIETITQGDVQSGVTAVASL
ncbi:MAG: hypothetical protein ACRDL7_11715, partial [Gaiellaceae bacterium]